ncbi:HdeD family acid-resistance protein [Orrella sp. 11846]|uniref:HdeD family acid-resistance protein n=1 Tax=Orrella sp. 11846 TaxID=3409913 RepID=UPI003B5947D5
MVQDPLSNFKDMQQQMLKKVAPHANKLVWIGVLMLILGTFGILAEVAFSIITIKLLGFAAIISGVLMGIHAFQTRVWKTFLIQTLLTVVYIVAGIYIWLSPIEALQGLTIWLAFLFFFTGFLRIIAAIQNWALGQAGWTLLSGVISILLGIMIMNGWPESSLWVPGMLLAIELILQGWALVFLGNALKRGDQKNL